mgnify:CR=1 FL=1
MSAAENFNFWRHSKIQGGPKNLTLLVPGAESAPDL